MIHLKMKNGVHLGISPKLSQYISSVYGQNCVTERRQTYPITTCVCQNSRLVLVEESVGFEGESRIGER